MANTLRFKRGLASGLPTGLAGEPLFTTDTFDLYIGNGTGNTRFQKYIASGTTSQLLRGDGSLLTMPIVLTSPSNGQVLKYDGTNWVNSADAGVTGSGTAGQVTYWGSSSTITGSNNLFWDNANGRLGIGTNAPTTNLEVSGGFNVTDGTTTIRAVNSGGIGLFGTLTNHDLALRTNNTQRARITAGGNFIINNSSTDNGLRFQVTGDGYFSGSVGIGSSTLAGFNLRVSKNITGGTIIKTINQEGTVQSDVTNLAFSFLSSARTAAASFNLSNYYHFYTEQYPLGAGSSITNQFGFVADNTLTGATNNYGFYGNIASGTGRWNLYMNGTANNYMAGSLGVGTTTMTYKFNVIDSGATYVAGFRGSANSYIVVGDTSLAGESGINFRNSSGQGFVGLGGTVLGISATSGANTITFSTGGSERARIDASGNLGLGVTPSAWTSTRAIQVGLSGSIANRSGGNGFYISSNLYFSADPSNTAANGVYINSDFATTYLQANGAHRWYNAPSGTAGNAITFTQAMTLFATGNLAVGTTTDAGYKLDVNGTMRVSGATRVQGVATLVAGAIFQATTVTQGFAIEYQSAAPARFYNAANSLSASIYHDGTGLLFTGAATFSSTAQAAGFITSGGTGYAVINSTATTVTALRPTGGGSSIMSTNSNGLHIAVGTQAAGDLILASNNTERIRLSQNGFFSQLNATNPSASITDSYIQYSADVTAGNAAPHFRTENGAVIKLYQETTAVGNAIVGAGGGSAMLDDDTFDGYTLRQVVRALRNQGILQ